MIERLILGLCLAASCAAAPIDWPHLKLTRVAQGLAEPVVVTSAHDGTERLFIAERFGKIKVLHNGAILPEPFLDISSKLNTEHYSHGILGLAFPPGFAARQHLYVHYTPDRHVILLSRFHVLPGSDVASVASEEVILTMPLAFEGGPSAGDLGFGPDGHLYIFRDASNTYQPQHFDNLLGKILRIDVHSTTSGYVIPAGNPFANHSTHRPEIWSWGFFHPHSLSFDRLTGDLYVIDRQGMKCEVNLQNAGSKGGIDYGSPVPEHMPGSPSATYERPAHIITSEETFGLTGFIGRDISAPRMNGIYFMGHLRSGQLAGLGRDGTNWLRQDFPEALTSGHTFGEDEAGRLFAVSRYEGTLDRLDDSGKVRPPILPTSGVIYTDTPILRAPSPGSVIRYTIDGRDPIDGDPEIASGQTIMISTGMTVKAQALRPDLLPSEIAVATYAVLKVAPPIFTPSIGAWHLTTYVTNATAITITSATPRAVVRYTRDGTQPTPLSSIYTKPLIVTSNQIVHARAYRTGFTDSDVNRVTYEMARTAAPTFTPVYSPITNGTTVKLFCSTPGAVIRYTINGTWPSQKSPKYTGPFRINGNTLMRTRAFAPGYLGSDLREAWYALVPVATPVTSPSSGPVAWGTTVTITCATPGAILRYTTNGPEPTGTSPIYSKPIKIYDTTWLRVRGYKPEHNPSEVTTEGYYLQFATSPIFSPAAGPIKKYTPIVITAQPRLAQIRYTLDGTEPNESSRLYRRPIVVDGPVTLSARAYAFGYSASAVTIAYFGCVDQESTIVQTLAGTGQAGLLNGLAGHARFRSPHALCINDHGTIFVADSGNHVIRTIATNGLVRTLLGSGDPASWDGIGTNASFSQPTGIAIDSSSNLWVVDSGTRAIRVITPDLSVRTITQIPPGSGGLWQLDLASTGALYLGAWANIVTVTASGIVGHFAGPNTQGTGARGWGALTAAALDSRDRVFAVTGYQLLAFNGSTEQTLAGGVRGFSDGLGLKARFTAPNGIAIGRDNQMFVTDDHLVRLVNTNGYVSTLAGYGTRGFRNGPSSIAQFAGNTGICVDKHGVVYVADANNHAIRKISFDRDQDTIPDPEDATVGTDDRLVDSDGDGQSNAEEFWAATNPNDSSSRLKIQARIDGSNGVVLSWPTAPARSYVITSSTNLVDWTSLPAVPVGGAMAAITNSLTAPRTFYRLRVEP